MTTSKSKLAKMKKDSDADDYYHLCLNHKELLATFFDTYMEFRPNTVRSMFRILFPLNRCFKLFLIHFLFYHTVWWSNNSTSNNLAINYAAINNQLFFILFYLNFYDLLVSKLLIKIFLYHLLKFLHFKSSKKHTLEAVLNIAEVFVYFFITLFIVYTLSFQQNKSVSFLIYLLAPHFFFLIYHKFDIRIKLFNFILFNNTLNCASTSISSYQLEEQILDTASYNRSNSNDHYNSASNSKNDKGIDDDHPVLVYTDCSNISISSLLNSTVPAVQNTINLANNESSQSSNMTSNNQNIVDLMANKINMILQQSNSQQQTIKIIKQSLNKNKSVKSKQTSWWSNLIIFRIFQKTKSAILKVFHLVHVTFNHIINFPKTSELLVRKRNLFAYVSRNDSTSYIQHRCQRDSIGVRKETELFKCEYNQRLCETILKTIESVYFNFIITRLSVPSHIFVREKEFIIYFVSSVLSTFLSYWLYYLPFSFLVTLKRNSEHLGKWKLVDMQQVDQIDGSTTILQSSADVSKWSNTKQYYRGDKVVYMGKVYEAESLYCSSIPGNKIHERFYNLFLRPIRIKKYLLFTELISKLLLCVYLISNTRWYSIITNIIEMLFNCHLFFIIFRDYFILKKYDNCNKAPFSITSSTKKSD